MAKTIKSSGNPLAKQMAGATPQKRDFTTEQMTNNLEKGNSARTNDDLNNQLPVVPGQPGGNNQSNDINIHNQTDYDAIAVRLAPSKGSYDKTQQTRADEKLWHLIRKRTVNMNVYIKLMNEVLAGDKAELNDIKFYTHEQREIQKNRSPYTNSQAYTLLKFATEKFVKATLDLNDEKFYPDPALNLAYSPYYASIEQKIADYKTALDSECDVNGCQGVGFKPHLLELIWSYWHEEGMMVQTMNAIVRRFQNIRNSDHDPLGNLEIDPLRPLNNLLWGLIQDSPHRLTVARRAYEYNHHYGITLIGKVIQNFRPADSRSKFIAAFHNLLSKCCILFTQADNLTIRPDGFSLLNALKEVHLLLAEGAHNQFGDLPSTAKVEMLMEQYILSRPEVREFLGGRLMVPYDEPWMDRVDTMKTLQGWPATSITYFHDLAVKGESILLSIRNTAWSMVNDRDFATFWAIFWRNDIQRYIHCYHSVTGIDLGNINLEDQSQKKYLMPAQLIVQKHLEERSLKRG